ncbi:NADPH2:quinone reductase [Pseudonocardia hierapolitana]|uniref:NADPH2:quinone reductase n=1 Tax=Pseudonocardia hierapolitana TaxID=1128676 RepID=A0A561T5B4_9PSEU|nr:NADPH:quinone reductase [Pseudonocardia hierapolitana]TWF82285.1 NADPH2:quinone reductase [Pseudonocardia hierapolitana]
MRAAYYEEQGPAHEVVRVGEVPTPEPGPGEVRVRVAVSGVHVGDVGKRRGYWGSTMTYPRVIPHGDGAGTVDAVGPGVDPARVGEPVWVYLAQSYRPFGTAAEYTVVPAGHAVRLPDGVGWEQAAVVGIPGITGHRAVFASGPAAGRTVLVTGPLGGVGRAALAVARRGGATVVATVRRAEQVDEVLAAGAHHVVVLGADAARQIRAIAPDGVDRVAEIDLAGNAALDVEILAVGGTIATYATGDPGASLPYWPLAFRNITVQFLSNDDFPEPANEHAARDLTAALAAGDLRYPIAARFPLERTADAQDAAERTGAAGRVVVEIDA